MNEPSYKNITIKNATEEDAGIYSCTSSNQGVKQIKTYEMFHLGNLFALIVEEVKKGSININVNHSPKPDMLTLRLCSTMTNILVSY